MKWFPLDYLHYLSDNNVYVIHVQLKRVSILKKYDEEIEGEKKSSFALGELLLCVP